MSLLKTEYDFFNYFLYFSFLWCSLEFPVNFKEQLLILELNSFISDYKKYLKHGRTKISLLEKSICSIRCCLSLFQLHAIMSAAPEER